MDRALYSIEEARARLGGISYSWVSLSMASILSALFLPHRPFGQALGIDLAFGRICRSTRRHGSPRLQALVDASSLKRLNGAIMCC
jgi:hypothetical protein